MKLVIMIPTALFGASIAVLCVAWTLDDDSVAQPLLTTQTILSMLTAITGITAVIILQRTGRKNRLT